VTVNLVIGAAPVIGGGGSTNTVTTYNSINSTSYAVISTSDLSVAVGASGTVNLSAVLLVRTTKDVVGTYPVWGKWQWYNGSAWVDVGTEVESSPSCVISSVQVGDSGTSTMLVETPGTLTLNSSQSGLTSGTNQKFRVAARNDASTGTRTMTFSNPANAVADGSAGGGGSSGSVVANGNYGDITVSGPTWTINNNAVNFAKLINATGAGIIGATAAGAFSQLTGAQVNSILPAFSASANGLAPASGGGTTNFLRADGTWTTPSVSVTWGSIGGTLSSQTDLQTALNAKANLSGGNTFAGNQTFSNDVTVNGTLAAGGSTTYLGPLGGAAADNNIYFSNTNVNQFWTFWRQTGGSPVTQAQVQVNDSAWRFGSPQFNLTNVNGSTTYATLTSTALAVTGGVTSNSPSAGIGYATGAGGGVTQTTSRTTGVTINKICGQITLFSAAGSPSWATFPVTNSTVAAGDTVLVTSQSATNTYAAVASKVISGGFSISFAAVSGTATDAPVFNFAVIKAVAA
jgi:hypothetical protein